MSSIVSDIKLVFSKIVQSFFLLSMIFTYPILICKKFSLKRPKFKIFEHLTLAIFPKAKLTYWLADEEVVVYITNFKKKDRYSLAYKEIETGRIVIVNSGNPINFRLEQLKPGDGIEHTQVEQNQKY